MSIDDFPRANVWHRYDIDIVEVYKQYKDYISSSGKSFTWRGVGIEDLNKRIDFLFKCIFEVWETDIDTCVRAGYKILIHAGHTNFLFLLALKLLLSDKFRLGRILDYHRNDFETNYPNKEGPYFRYIEFAVADFLKNFSVEVDGERLARIMEWVEKQEEKEVEKREFDLSAVIKDEPKPDKRKVGLEFVPAKAERSKSNKGQKQEIEKQVSFTDEFIDEVLPEFKKYLIGDRKKSIDKLFCKGSRVSKRLIFNGPASQLIEFLKRCKYNQKLVCTNNDLLARWMNRNFSYKDAKRKSDRAISKDNAFNILKNPTKESPRRILKDKVPYIKPAHRKK